MSKSLLIIFGTILSGIGLAMTGSMSAIALTNIQEEHKNVAYAIYQQIRQLGGTIGAAIIGAIISNLDTYCFTTKIKALNYFPTNEQISFDKVLSLTTNDLIPNFINNET